MNRNRFIEKFKTKSNSELKLIILEEEKYDYKAVTAAKTILTERGVNIHENQKEIIVKSPLNSSREKISELKKDKTLTNTKEDNYQYLQIFVNQKTFPISNENLIFIFLIALTSLNYYIYNSSKIENKIFESLGVIFTLITFIYFIILIISNLFRHERLRGKLSGRLIFEKDKIHFGCDTYNIRDIKEIVIENWYVKGDIVNVITPTLKPKKSNGVKNYVKLYLKNGTIETCYFLQTKTDRIQKFSKVFKSYFNLGIINEQNYINITEIYNK